MLKRFAVFLLLPLCVYSKDFDSIHNKYSHEKIKRYIVLGERSSGTKFLSVLINDNFDVQNANNKNFHKHFIPWLSVSNRAKKDRNQLTYIESLDYFKKTDDVLFIAIIRNPYDWLRSFYNHGWHVPSEIKSSFTSFITHTWGSTEYEVDNYNPWTGRPFENILELRRYKIYNFCNVGKFVKNFVVLAYEDLCEDQKDFVQFITKKFNIKKKNKTVVEDVFIGTDKERVNKTFIKPKYFIPTQDELSFINQHSDWELESSFGYSQMTLDQLIKENQ